MRRSFPRSIGAAMVVLGVLVATSPATGQQKDTTAPPPRTPWGHPDLQGTWDRHSITPLERPKQLEGREFLTEEEAAQLEQAAILANTDEERPSDIGRDVSSAYNDFWWDRATKVVSTRRTSLIVDPPDGKVPPLTARAEERAKLESTRPVGSLGTGGRGADSWLDRSLWERCITQGSSRLASGAYNANFQIFQSADAVVVLHEQIHEARVIPLDGRPHLPPSVRQWLGDSRGRWEGNTLVVETTNFSDKTNFRGSTDGLRMIERISRADAETLNYEVTFEDPSTWTRPWTVQMPMPKTAGSMYEYACHEGNYGLKGILAGARAEEKAAEEARKKGSR
ncbi:MAG: hypothetical protein GEU82_05045 [Luteitalea sp.]|nr:hypothetical protein [Luteitalea sp.]